MAHTVSTVKNQARSFASCIQTENCLLLKENLWSTKLLKEYIRGFDSIIERVEWRLCQQNWMLLGLHLELVKDMAPKSLHIIPVCDDSVLNWVSQLQNTLVFVLRKSNKN